MSHDSREIRIRTDGYTRLCLGAIVVLVALLAMGLWAERAPMTEVVHAEKPFLDSGTQVQLVQLLEAQRQTTAKLDELIRLFRSGQVTVKVEKDTKEKANASTRRTSK
jgi:hypothetical protein